MSGEFSGMLNRSTPFAPTSDEEVSKRLESKRIDQQESSTSFESARETGAAYELARKGTELDRWDVFVPVREKPHRDDGPVVVQYEVRDMGEGRGAVLIYTTPEVLMAELGEFQPMVKVDVIELLRRVRGQVPVVVNPILGSGIQKRHAPEVD
jgi:hypothetical protein